MKLAKIVICTLIVIVNLEQVLSSKEYSKAKWSSKDKLGKWNGKKKASSSVVEKPVKKKLKVKLNRKEEDEKRRICQSYSEDTLSDFLLKFGTVTKLIEDVSEFEMKLKAAEEASVPWKKKKKLWKAHRGLTGDKYNDGQFVNGGRGRLRQKQIKHNHLGDKAKKSKRKKVKTERSNDDGSVHSCYGYNYLSSMGALETDSATSAAPKMPDMNMMREFFMDLSDMDLSDSLTKLADMCMEKNKEEDVKGCPTLFSLPKPSSSTPEDEEATSSTYYWSSHSASHCPERCLSHNDCAASEICCPTQCGGNACFNPSFRSKYRSADAPLAGASAAKMAVSKKKKKFDASRKCAVADKFMQCLYNGIGDSICN